MQYSNENLVQIHQALLAIKSKIKGIPIHNLLRTNYSCAKTQLENALACPKPNLKQINYNFEKYKVAHNCLVKRSGEGIDLELLDKEMTRHKTAIQIIINKLNSSVPRRLKPLTIQKEQDNPTNLAPLSPVPLPNTNLKNQKVVENARKKTLYLDSILNEKPISGRNQLAAKTYINQMKECIFDLSNNVNNDAKFKEKYEQYLFNLEYATIFLQKNKPKVGQIKQDLNTTIELPPSRYPQTTQPNKSKLLKFDDKTPLTEDKLEIDDINNRDTTIKLPQTPQPNESNLSKPDDTMLLTEDDLTIFDMNKRALQHPYNGAISTICTQADWYKFLLDIQNKRIFQNLSDKAITNKFFDEGLMYINKEWLQFSRLLLDKNQFDKRKDNLLTHFSQNARYIQIRYYHGPFPPKQEELRDFKYTDLFQVEPPKLRLRFFYNLVQYLKKELNIALTNRNIQNDQVNVK